MTSAPSRLSDVASWTFSWIHNAEAYPDRASLVRAGLAASRVDGLFCEFGVYNGSSIRFIAESIAPRTVYGFDSFQGLPKEQEEFRRENWPAGAFSTSAPQNLPSNVKLIPGWFQETLPRFVSEHQQPAAFLHCDADLYSSTKTILECFEPLIVRGTVLLFDEMLWWPGWDTKGEAKAWAEFIDRTGHEFECLGTQEEKVAVRIKS